MKKRIIQKIFIIACVFLVACGKENTEKTKETEIVTEHEESHNTMDEVCDEDTGCEQKQNVSLREVETEPDMFLGNVSQVEENIEVDNTIDEEKTEVKEGNDNDSVVAENQVTNTDVTPNKNTSTDVSDTTSNTTNNAVNSSSGSIVFVHECRTWETVSQKISDSYTYQDLVQKGYNCGNCNMVFEVYSATCPGCESSCINNNYILEDKVAPATYLEFEVCTFCGSTTNTRTVQK